MGRTAAISVVLLPLVLATACSNSSGGSHADNTPSKASGSTPASSAPSPNARSVEKSLRLPAQPKYLVPVRKGKGAEDLPDFMPGKKVYSVHIKCSGTDTMKIIKRERPKDNPSPIDCDSPVTIGKVYVDPVKQKLAIQADDGARWTIAIVDGERPL
ncbi:hypothetical protein ACFQ0X_21005 [Streptomyces rectiviolaceus]|uniref:Lipoprotein n=1 Tax=Streptomyces rectiviolaceus TaxID=332591 RepID=A0ABP6NKI0_9ACTN